MSGIAITSITPDESAAVATAMLIVQLVRDGENVAATVPVETGVEEPCAAGSHGSLIRWAAGHLDDPRLVTPFAFEAARPVLHAADVDGTLVHSAAFDKARNELSEGRTFFVAHDAVGPLDTITPSLTMLDLFARWELSVIIAERVSRASVGHVRLLAEACSTRGVPVAGVLLTPAGVDANFDVDAVASLRDSMAALLGCAVIVVPAVQSFHDRAELVAAADACEINRVVPRRRTLPTGPEQP